MHLGGFVTVRVALASQRAPVSFSEVVFIGDRSKDPSAGMML